jgi:hypothetical protein
MELEMKGAISALATETGETSKIWFGFALGERAPKNTV